MATPRPAHPLEAALGAPLAPLVAAVRAAPPFDRLFRAGFDMDHACWRCADADEYLSICALAAQHGTRLVEGMIGGRPISTFRLHHPIEVAVAAVAARAGGGGAADADATHGTGAATNAERGVGGGAADSERGVPPLVLRARLLEVPYPKPNRPYPSGWEVRRGGEERREMAGVKVCVRSVVAR